MDRGGAETWLMHVLRALDRQRVRMDFLVTSEEPGHYDDEIRSLGSEVIPCALAPGLASFVPGFLNVLRQRGPYAAVHSHVHHFSGAVLALARIAGVPVRIAHSHLDTRDGDRRAGLGRRLYLAGMTAALARVATHGIAVSSDAAVSLYGAEWREDPRWQVVRCALDLSAFREPLDPAAVRRELGIPPDARVFGHVGRFDPQKNHAFLIEIATALLQRDTRSYFVLVGDGPLRRRIEQEAAHRGIEERVIFAGVRRDVPRLLRSFDAFVFPSLHEGLPLVGIEAQAAGLPLICSDRVTRELVVMPELFTWLSTADVPEVWAAAALDASRERIEPRRALAALDESEFSLARTIPQLLAVYTCAQPSRS
jgi:glycosyltransferase involved in cell wall biosynthesis